MLETPLSEKELDELDRFLLSDDLPEETMPIDELDGYLTALVCSPVELPPGEWLDGIWGWPEEDVFAGKKQAERIATLISRHLNGIIGTLEEAPETFEPLVHAAPLPDDPREYLAAEYWAIGFVKGVALLHAEWQPLFDDPAGTALYRPIHLLGGAELTDEESELVSDPVRRDELARQLSASIAAIYRFWEPYRKNLSEDLVPLRREQPKVGRNDPCPCGSGKKFKKCCGSGEAPQASA